MTGNAEPRAWAPGADLETMRLRAQILNRTRGFFNTRDVLEVETPLLSRSAVTDPALDSLRTVYTGPGAPEGVRLYLHTSPEFPMKRLLAAGSGSIYQICRVFRDGELGRLHNPEFTLLEWYRPGFTLLDLMDEVADLLIALFDGMLSCGPVERISYRDVFLERLQLDPLVADLDAVLRCARQQGLVVPAGMMDAGLDAWLDLLLTHCIESGLGNGCMTFVYRYPANQASLARLTPDDPRTAERFELYLNGIEIANGFHELADAREQRSRFRSDNRIRSESGKPQMPLDEKLLDALEAGLPDCSGVAVGLDRLVLLAAQAGSLDQVMAFSLDRA